MRLDTKEVCKAGWHDRTFHLLRCNGTREKNMTAPIYSTVDGIYSNVRIWLQEVGMNLSKIRYMAF